MPPTPAHDRYLADHADRYLDELHAFLRIPSVSALPAHRPDVFAAADWLADRLRAIGVPEVSLLPTGAGPVVVGHWPVPGQPTALLYGHYDVQPADPLELWASPPFEPTVRDGRLFARGASDDKGALLAALNGIEALVETDGAPPIGLTFFLEGEEEIGSPALPDLVRAERDRLACDFVISADGAMYARETPSLTVATKGLAGCQIDLRTATTDLHSGQFGAAAPNAARSLAELVAGLHDADGRVAVAGFYDRVLDLTAEERAEIAAVPFAEADYLQQIGAPAPWGEPGYSALERAFARPTLDVNGLWGGFQGEGAKTVTPAEAHAKLTCRLVPDQDPDAILSLIERHVANHLPTGAVATVSRHPGAARPFVIRRDHPALRTAGEVLRDLYVAEIFRRELGADMVFFAWEMPDTQLHAPNEFIALADFRLSSRAYCAYLDALAR